MCWLFDLPIKLLQLINDIKMDVFFINFYESLFQNFVVLCDCRLPPPQITFFSRLYNWQYCGLIISKYSNQSIKQYTATHTGLSSQSSISVDGIFGLECCQFVSGKRNRKKRGISMRDNSCQIKRHFRQTHTVGRYVTEVWPNKALSQKSYWSLPARLLLCQIKSVKRITNIQGGPKK